MIYHIVSGNKSYYINVNETRVVEKKNNEVYIIYKNDKTEAIYNVVLLKVIKEK